MPTTKDISFDFFEELSLKYSGCEFTAQDISKDKELLKLLNKKNDKSITSTERSLKPVNEHKCLARVWSGGYGGQCSRNQTGEDKLCTLHRKGLDSEGKWWLGMVNGIRPPDPIHPKNHNVHHWLITEDGKPIEKVSKKKKENVSVKVIETTNSEKVDPVLIEQQQEKAEEFKNAFSYFQTKKFIDGIKYNYNPDTNMIIDPNDLSEMGEWNQSENSINFEDEVSENKHTKKVSQLRLV